MIKIALVDDHEILRDGMKALLKEQNDIMVVEEATNGRNLIEKVKNIDVDIVLLDINMPVMDGFETTRYLTEHFPEIKVIALSMHNNQKHVKEMMDAGAKGYIFKNTGKEELLNAINIIAKGDLYVCSAISLNFIDKGNEENTEENNIASISKREMEVLKLIAAGLTNKQMADKLFNSRRTIETHRRNLLEKTKTNNTATLIKYALTHGII